MIRAFISVSASFAVAVFASPSLAQLGAALQESGITAQESGRSQEEIDRIDDETGRLLNDYRAVLRQLDATRRHNASLSRNIERQKVKIESLKGDIESVKGLQRAMGPLMEDMVSGLDSIVSVDVPFRLGERAARIDRLRGVLDNPDVPAPQRYRLIVEAYQIESEYGRTISAYNGEIETASGPVTGDFLQIGRIALIFKTRDDSVLKIWDNDSGAFVDLPSSYLQDVKFNFRVANEQTAPDIMFVPVLPPVSVPGPLEGNQ